MSIRNQLFLGFFVLILIFIIDFFVNKRLSDQVLKNTSYISNSEAVIRNSNILHKDLIEMQSGFRGFLLTGQETFLQPFYEGLLSVPPLFKEQRSLLTSEKQKIKLDSINQLHQEWLEYANSLISTKLDTLPEAEKKYIELFETKLRMEVGKNLNDKIQKKFQALDNFEYDLRQERRTILQKSIVQTRGITLTLTLVSIILALSSSIYIIRLVTSRISKMVTFAENISKGNFKPMEDTKKDELNNLSESLNKMSQTLEQNFLDLTMKNNELDQFAYVVSHDLKAPLRGISNIISWIEEDHSNDLLPGVKDNMSLIKGRADRLENMINGLLKYARIGKMNKGFEPVNTQELVKEIADILVPANFKFKMEGKFPTFATEKIHIEQMFSNLISNAVKYNNNDTPEIIVRFEELTGSYKFGVIDNGTGIQAEYFDKIFVIFQTLQERDAFESTGVGLAIVKKIIDDYKGTIKVESIVNKGSTFTFTWPKTKK